MLPLDGVLGVVAMLRALVESLRRVVFPPLIWFDLVQQRFDYPIMCIKVLQL
jgi:hypothetical protein